MLGRLAGGVLLLWAGAFAWFAIALPQPAPPERTDGIVVLTGSAGRIERGVELLRRGRAERLLISGVALGTGKTSIRRLYGIPSPLMRCCIDLGHDSVDTRSNARETMVWIKRHDYRTVRLITSDWHMRRAEYELTRQLPPGVSIVRDAVRTQPSLRILLFEYHKYLLRLAAGLLGI